MTGSSISSIDRKSTRLNFSHDQISYAVFCLKKKNVPVWVGREGNSVLVCTGEGSHKGKNPGRDPLVSLYIVDFHDPYREAHFLFYLFGDRRDLHSFPTRRSSD